MPLRKHTCLHRYLSPAFADVIAAATGSTTACACNDRYRPLCKEMPTSTEFTFFEVPAPYKDARAKCQSLGGDLASIHSEAENAEAYAVAVGSHSWIGLQDMDKEGSFVWSDGSELNYTAWFTGEPNEYASNSNQDCTAFLTVGGGGGKWYDLSCTENLPFLCRGTGGSRAGKACVTPTCLDTKPHCLSDNEAGKLSRRLCPITCGTLAWTCMYMRKLKWQHGLWKSAGCDQIDSPLLRIGQQFGCPKACQAAPKELNGLPCTDVEVGSERLSAYAEQFATIRSVAGVSGAFVRDSILQYGCAFAASAADVVCNVEGDVASLGLKTMRHLCPKACKCTRGSPGCPASCTHTMHRARNFASLVCWCCRPRPSIGCSF